MPLALAHPLLLLGIWIAILGTALTIWILVFLWREHLDRRHLEHCIEAATEAGESDIRDRICSAVATGLPDYMKVTGGASRGPDSEGTRR